MGGSFKLVIPIEIKIGLLLIQCNTFENVQCSQFPKLKRTLTATIWFSLLYTNYRSIPPCHFFFFFIALSVENDRLTNSQSVTIVKIKGEHAKLGCFDTFILNTYAKRIAPPCRVKTKMYFVLIFSSPPLCCWCFFIYFTNSLPPFFFSLPVRPDVNDR